MAHELLTPKELARRLKTTVETISRLTTRGQLPVHRIGRLPRYDWQEVLAMTKDTVHDQMNDILRDVLKR